MSKLVITRMEGSVVTALAEGDRIVQLHLDREENSPRVGDIYVGRVQRALNNIDAVFIELTAEGTVGFYALAKGEKAPAPGTAILVQVSREAQKTKAAAVTTRLTFPGRFVVLTENGGRVAVSSKIVDPSRRDELKALLQPLCDGVQGYIVRTNGETASEEEILAEAKALCRKCRTIREQAAFRTVFQKLASGPAPYLQSIQDFPGWLPAEGQGSAQHEIVTDQRDLYQEIEAFLQGPAFAGDENRPSIQCRLYEDALLPLYQLYRLKTIYEDALKKRVWLKSGGYLVIEPTEALTVIDVNTGKFDGHKNREDTFFRINREAARELAYQLRLRNLSGIIIVDFIDMESEEKRQTLLRELAEWLRQDPVKTVLVDMTRLNLVEITRKKLRPPLHEQ